MEPEELKLLIESEKYLLSIEAFIEHLYGTGKLEHFGEGELQALGAVVDALRVEIEQHREET